MYTSVTSGAINPSQILAVLHNIYTIYIILYENEMAGKGQITSEMKIKGGR